LGEVVGVPDRKVNGIDLLPEERRKKYKEAQRKAPMTGAAGSLTSKVAQAAIGRRAEPSAKIDRSLKITLKDGSVVQPTEIGGSTTFYHASSKKRQGRLVPNTAPQWGKAIYFALNRQSATDEFGENVTEARLNLKNPLYTNTRDIDAVDKKAAELYNREMLPEILKDQAELVNGQWKFFDEYWQAEYDKNGYIDWYSASDAEEGKYFGEAAIELGYDAIIDSGGQYGTEIAVLDESSIIYPEDIISTSSRPSAQPAIGRRSVEETAKALEGKDAAEKNKLKNISEPTSVTAEDGWTFVRMSDGSYTDGDQIYDSWESLKKVGESEDLGLRQSTELEEKNGREIAKDIQDEIDGREFSDELSIWNYLNDEGLKRLGYDSPMEMSDIDREIHANLIAKGVDEFKKSNLKLVEDANKLIGKSIDESISVAYHKAKVDGSNPELVKAVEDLIGKPQFAAGRAGGVSQDTILDAMDEVDNAIESGVSAEQAIQENILSQPWYGQLSDDQKAKVDSVINTEYGVNPSEIVTASESAQKLEDLYNSQEKGYKNKIQDLLADDPELKYIYNNIPKILSALEQEGVIKKNKNCP
jgi:hypothetical protein